MTGNVGRVVGVVAILTVLAGAIHAVALVLPMMSTTVTCAVASPIDAAGITLLYLELRGREEGYSREAIAEGPGTRDTTNPSP